MTLPLLDLCILDKCKSDYWSLRFVAMKFSVAIAESKHKILATDAYTAVTAAGVIIPWIKFVDEVVFIEWNCKRRNLHVRINDDGVTTFIGSKPEEAIVWSPCLPQDVEGKLFHLGRYLIGGSIGNKR